MEQVFRERTSDAPERCIDSEREPLAADNDRRAGLRSRLSGVIAHRRWVAAVALCASLVALPTLRAGMILDDYVIGAFVLDHLNGQPSTRAWWNMFDSYGRTDSADVPNRIASGALYWWSPPMLKLAFLRPLATASHCVDYLLWPQQPWLMHLHNIAWYACLAALAAYLYRKLLAPFVAALAAVLYALDEAHVQGVSWIASRNTVMTAALVLLTLAAWVHSHEHAHARGARWLAAFALLAAHASSEGAYAVWPYLIGFALLREPTERLKRLWPLAAVSCCWFVLARVLGYGTRGGELYVDPRTAPWLFVQMAVQRFPDLLRAQFALPQPLERELVGQAQAVVIALSCALIVALALLVLPILRRDPVARMFALGFFGSAILACAASVDPRMLLLVGLGAHALVAQVIWVYLREWRGRSLRRILCATVAALLLMLHGPVALALSPYASEVMPAMDTRARKLALSLFESSIGSEHVMVLNAPDLMYTSFAAVYLTVLTGRTRSAYVLGSSPERVQLSRPAVDTLVLEAPRGYLHWFSAVDAHDAEAAFTVGQVIQTRLWRTTIERITADGRPVRVRFELLDAEDSSEAWVFWNPARDAYERTGLPPVGSTIWLPGLHPLTAAN